MAVIGDDQKPVPKGTPGLLRVESEWIAEGYLDAAPGGDCFHPFPRSDSGRIFLTGDVVVEEEETLHLLGRSGSMIKHRGAWIDTSPLHNALQAEGIGEIHLDKSGERDALRVWMQMESPDRELLRKVASRLEQTFADSPLLPEIVVGIGKFPLNSNGKKDLCELARLAESGAVFTEKISTRVERLASILVNEEWDSRLLKGARQIGDLELDSLSLHELLLEIERLSGKAIPLWKMQPATSLTEILHTSGELPQAFGRLEGKVGAPVLLWMGDGVTGIRHDLGNQVTILHWNVSALPGALGTKNVSTLRELAGRLIGMIDSKDLSGRIVVGGFSMGAILAHEISLLLSDRGIPPEGLLLIDPPDLDYRPIRSPWRWSRWRPLILCRLLGMMPEFVMEARSGALRRLLVRETMRHLKEQRRALMRNYKISTLPIHMVLATSVPNHEGALRCYGHVSPKIEVLPLGVGDHLKMVSDLSARSRWIAKMRGFLFGS